MEEQQRYIITDDKNYVMFNKNKEQDTTTDKKRAQVFETYNKAENFRKCIKKTLQFIRWEVKELTHEIEIHEQKEESFTYRKTIFEDENFNWKEKINTIEIFQEDLKQYRENLRQQQIENEQEIVDLYHYIELYDDFSASQGYKAYRMLKERLKVRRHVKDELKRVQYVESSSSESIINGDLNRAFETLEHRQYSPRVLKELFSA